MVLGIIKMAHDKNITQSCGINELTWSFLMLFP